MLVDWLICGALIFAITKIINATLLKSKPASPFLAWTLTTIIFVVNIIVFSSMKYMQYEAISENIGTKIAPKNPLDFSGAFIFAWVFFSLLKREKKKDN